MIYHGIMEANLRLLQPGTRTYVDRNGIRQTLAATRADGIRFGYMITDGVPFVVKADKVLLSRPVPISGSRHLDGKSQAPSPTTFGNQSARNLINDMIKANPGLQQRLIPLFESFPRVRPVVPPLRKERKGKAKLPHLTRDSVDYSATEGHPRLVTHLVRERNRNLAMRKKAEVLRLSGTLTCEVCGFDSARQFPSLEITCAEVHHLRPIGAAARPARTTLRALAILCSNCHRMVHYTDPLKSPAALRKLLRRGA